MIAGDVQWMTAGRGILHQEMPKGDQQGRMHGFQLWANLPSSLKMTDPRYQDIPASAIPEVTDDDGTHVRIICGEFWGRGDLWKEWPLIRIISISRLRPAIGSGLRSRLHATPSPMCSRARERFGTLRSPRGSDGASRKTGSATYLRCP